MKAVEDVRERGETNRQRAVSTARGSFRKSKDIGMMTNLVWSFRMKPDNGYQLIFAEVPGGTIVEVVRSGQPVLAKLAELRFR